LIYKQVLKPQIDPAAMIDKWLNLLEAYLGKALEFIALHLMTVEGIVALIFGIFFVGLLAQLRS